MNANSLWYACMFTSVYQHKIDATDFGNMKLLLLLLLFTSQTQRSTRYFNTVIGRTKW